MENKKTQCHFISNTHWDREWRFSARRTQYMLVYMIDMLLDILDKYPEFKHFHMDSQTMPLQDYLQVRPQNKEKLIHYIKEGRIAVGPWFCLPDEFCVSGESLVRNLLLGHRIAKEFGGVSKTGYSPFGWGQISQMPQLYKGFDIDFASFYRGLNEYVAPKSEFFWESPDGTRIHASRLGKRPRYNIFYLIQRAVINNMEDVNYRIQRWDRGYGLFRLANIGKELETLDFQYTHPKYEYYKEILPKMAEQAIREQDDDWSTPHRFWSCGHDQSTPDPREIDMIKDCDEILDSADVFHSTVKAMEEGIISEFPSDAPVWKGEMRNPSTKGSVSPLLGWIISARTDVKQANFDAECQLTTHAEPMAVFAAMLGAGYPNQFIDLSYNYLLQNHGHDSMGTCGRDIVYKDVIARFRQSTEISSCVIERAFMDIAGDIDLSSWDNDVAIVLQNNASFKRSEVVLLNLDVPNFPKEGKLIITAPDGTEVPYQIHRQNNRKLHLIQSPNDAPDALWTTQFNISLFVEDIPAFGYTTLKVDALTGVRNKTPITLRTGERSMENEYLTVTVNSNGTFDVFDKENNRQYTNLGYFKDSGETGNPWQHLSPENDEVYTTLSEKANVTLIRDGELETSFKASMTWSLPESGDGLNRFPHMVDCKIDTVITLRKGQRYVEIMTTFDNRAENHYLQAAFPTGINYEYSCAQGQFDVCKRQAKKLDYTLYDETPMDEHPMNSFVDVSDGKIGAALLNTGLKAYEAGDDSIVYLSLLRAFPLSIAIMEDKTDYSKTDKDSQCVGTHTFRYAFMPHKGDWEQGGVWAMSEQFNTEIKAALLEPTSHGKNGLSKSFLELRSEGLNVSAVKQSENGGGYVIRLFNPSDKTVKNALRLNGGIAPVAKTQSPVERQTSEFKLPEYSSDKWKGARLVNLEETPQSDLVISDDGFVEFEITGKKILTIEFLA